jgi:Tfp pilus assembly protein PilV
MALVRKHRRRSERGFTLLELMYAFGYFMLGITGLVFFQSVAANSTQRAGDISMATMITGGTIEEMRANPNVNLPVNAVAYWDRFGNSQMANGTTNPNYTGTVYFTVTTTASSPTGNFHYYDVQVATNWYQLPAITFQHGVVMQTRVPTE